MARSIEYCWNSVRYRNRWYSHQTRTRVRKITDITIGFPCSRVCCSFLLACRMPESRIYQVFDFYVLRQLGHAVTRATGMTRKSTQMRSLTTCTPAHIERSLYSSHRAMHSVQIENAPFLYGIRPNAIRRQRDTYDQICAQRFQILRFPWKGSWIRTLVIVATVPSRRCVASLHEGNVNGSMFFELRSRLDFRSLDLFHHGQHRI